MPPRHVSVQQYQQISHLLNLPFLAPRLLAPWPNCSVKKKAFANYHAEPTKSTNGDVQGIPHIVVEDGSYKAFGGRSREDHAYEDETARVGTSSPAGGSIVSNER